LDVANSVVSAIEAYFPYTIDKLRKERSTIDGPKLILLEDIDEDILFSVLLGAENYKSIRHSGEQQSEVLKKNPVEFGANQVIIVRDQKSKKQLPPLLRHALCLTVYESKGLEFDQVILYNFFAESPASNDEWKELKSLKVEQKQVDKGEYERKYFTYDEGQTDNDSICADYDPKTDKYTMRTIQSATTQKDPTDLGMLCNDLKQLYVALTRARNRIIIYDKDIQKRKFVERYWKDLGVVEIVTSDSIKADKAKLSKDAGLFKEMVADTNPDEWKKVGLKMFRNKFYEQALKCFEKAKDEKLVARAKAYMIAD
jgi:ATP-dependent exoDNAse (exonuclease V) beta subunit